MSEDLDKLERMLAQATAAQGQSHDGLDPESASLGEAWIAFGRLLEAAQPLQDSPLPFVGEGLGVRAVPRPAPRRRWLLPMATAVLAASVLVGIATIWTFRTGTQPTHPVAPPLTASTNVKHPTPAPSGRQAAPTPAGPQWNDSWDDEIAQVGQNVSYVRQDLYAGPDPLSAVQYDIEQMQQDIAESKL